MTPSLLLVLGTIFADVALFFCLGFVISYGLFFKWWERPAGRAIMGFVSMLVAVVLLGWLARNFGTFEGYEIFRALTMFLTMVASGGLLWTLWATWARTPPDGIDLNDRVVDNYKEKKDNDPQR